MAITDLIVGSHIGSGQPGKQPEGELVPKAAEKRPVDTERQKALRERVLTGNSTPAATIRGVR